MQPAYGKSFARKRRGGIRSSSDELSRAQCKSLRRGPQRHATRNQHNAGGLLNAHCVIRYRIALVRDAVVDAGPWDAHVRNSSDVATFMMPLLGDLDREVFWVLMLDARHYVCGVHLVSVGSLTTAVVHPREVFKALVASNAAAAILVHNHPSGDPTPSAEDMAVTQRLREAGDLLGIPVLDHIVLGESGQYRSFADDGMFRPTTHRGVHTTVVTTRTDSVGGNAE